MDGDWHVLPAVDVAPPVEAPPKLVADATAVTETAPRFPPAANSVGTRYYSDWGLPRVYLGWGSVIRHLGRRYLEQGKPPRGFVSLEAAVRFASELHRSRPEIVLLFGWP